MAAMATMCAVCAAAADVAVNVALVAADTRPTAAQTTRGGLSIAVAAAMNWQVSIGIGVTLPISKPTWSIFNPSGFWSGVGLNRASTMLISPSKQQWESRACPPPP